MARSTAPGICYFGIDRKSLNLRFPRMDRVYFPGKRALLQAQNALIPHFQGVGRGADDGHGPGIEKDMKRIFHFILNIRG